MIFIATFLLGILSGLSKSTNIVGCEIRHLNAILRRDVPRRICDLSALSPVWYLWMSTSESFELGTIVETFTIFTTLIEDLFIASSLLIRQK
jgi:hypothetical protein